MSFGTSSTTFGAKPAGSAFGTQQQPQQGGGLFGNAQQQQPQGNPLFGGPQTTGSSLFGGGQQQQPPQGTSLFGSTQNQPPQQQGSSSLFGSTQTQPQQGSSLFGGANTQQQQQNQAGSSLFGGSTQQQNQPGPSLFGGGQPQPQPQQGSSLFGGPPAQQNPQSGTSSLFGSTQQPPQQGPSLFGNTSTQPQQQQSSVFGTQSSAWGSKPNPLMPQAAQSTGGFGGGASPLFNQGQQQQQQPTNMGTQSSGTPFFTKSTKFNDLPDNVKKAFEDIDGHIQGRVQIGKELKQRKLAEQATKGQDLIRETHKELGNAMTTLRSDYRLTKDVKQKVDQSVQDTIVAIRIIDGFRNPQQNGVHLKNHASFPLEFFERITMQMRDRLQWYKTTIEQIERKLTSASSQAQSTPQAITSSLEAQYATFVYLANKTATIDAELQKIKALYRQLWRAKTGSMRDPFNELDRGNGGDFGLDGLSV